MIKNLKGYVCLAALFSCFGAFANTAPTQVEDAATTTTTPAEQVVPASN